MKLSIAILTACASALVAAAPYDNSSLLISSPPYYPSPQGGRTQDEQWQEAYAKAREFVSKLDVPAKVNLTSGIASMGLCVGTTGDVVSENGEFWGLCLQDGPTGPRSVDYNTGFPPGISSAATFNKDLIYKRAKAIGSEFKGKGVDIMLGPVVGPLGMNQYSGRLFEGFGADPYLAGVAGAEAVKGIQDTGVIANAKHWIGNEQETNRLEISSNIGDRALHEVYAWPFADMIQAGLGSIMCSYNLLNNSYSCENSYSLNKVLKDELGFQGFVVSDWGATHSGVNAITSGLDMNMPGDDFFSGNLSIAVSNGTVPVERLDDMATRIIAAYYKANVGEKRQRPNFSSNTDADTDHLYSPIGQGPIVTVNKHVDVRTKENYKAAYDTAIESTVLVKNVNNTLPFVGEHKPKRIGVLGPSARENSMGANCGNSLGCSLLQAPNLGMQLIVQDGAAQLGGGSAAVYYPYFIAPYDGLQERAVQDDIVVDGFFMQNSSIEQFANIATNSDVNVIYGFTQSGEGFDRTNTSLQLDADDTILAAAKLNKNNVVVINTIGVVDVEKWIDHENVTAVIIAHPQGQDTGKAIADILFGDQEPSGRLPYTIAKSEKDYNKPVNGSKAANGFYQDDEIWKQDIWVDYRHFDHYNITPRFEFGYGLSYSTFEIGQVYVQEHFKPEENLPQPAPLAPPHSYGDKKPAPSNIVFPDGMEQVPTFLYPYINETSEAEPHGKYPFPDGYSTVQKNASTLPGGASGGNPALWKVAYTVTADVKNTGNVESQFVPQLYVQYPQSEEFPTPPRQLRGFEKVKLQPGASQSVSFDIKTRDLTVWDVKTASWIVLRGDYTFYVGSSSRDMKQKSQITL